MEKLIFLPHCLRSPECKAALGDQGYICISCGKCKIGSFRKKAEEKGYALFIVPGASMVKKLLKNYQSPQIIAVACDAELKEGISFAKKNNLNIKSIKLLRDGCVNTDADFDKLYSMI